MTDFFNAADLFVIAPFIPLFLASIVPISVKAFRGQELNPFVSMVWSVVGVVAAAGLTISLVNSYWRLSGLNFVQAFSGAIVVDGIAIWSSYVIYIITGFVLMLLYENRATRAQQFSEHIFLIMNSALGMALVIMSNNLLITFMAIELMSLSVYLLIALSKEPILSKEASFKYFVLGGVASAVFLYGIAFVYGAAGSVSLETVGSQFSQLFATNPLFVIGVVLIIAGMAFKVSMVPFHAWTPDVYQGSATPVTTFMSTGVKLASFIALLRIFIYSDSSQVLDLQYLMQWIAALTMIGGNLAALRQENIKRMLAYSSVSHSGYVSMGLIAATFGVGADEGTASMLFYLLAYSLMTIGALAVVSALESREDTLLSVDDLRGLSDKSPVMAFALSVLLLSLAGIPPTLGFFGKFYIFAAALSSGFYWLAFIGVLSSVLGVYFYLRPIVVMYMKEGGSAQLNPDTYLSQSVAFVMALAMLVFGVASSPLYYFVKQSVFGSL